MIKNRFIKPLVQDSNDDFNEIHVIQLINHQANLIRNKNKFISLTKRGLLDHEGVKIKILQTD